MKPWYIPEERCENCKWYDNESNGWCSYRAKFKDEDDEACDRYEREQSN